jgi:hypothetical protein
MEPVDYSTNEELWIPTCEFCEVEVDSIIVWEDGSVQSVCLGCCRANSGAGAPFGYTRYACTEVVDESSSGDDCSSTDEEEDNRQLEERFREKTEEITKQLDESDKAE